MSNAEEIERLRSILEVEGINPDAPVFPRVRKVYVVEEGAYEQRHVAGVYESVESAIAAHPIPDDFKYPARPDVGNGSRQGGWQKHEQWDIWDNGLDWDASKTITEHEVE